jgi:chemotaxis methyl-accepting protein methylase/nitrogen-specific signal transduction histidine kinase/chemotaxis response regulator CheB
MSSLPTTPIEDLSVAGVVDIVAIGASAGGLAACSKLLEHMPTDTGLAFVVVQHLDPHHPSLLVELLARTTSMPVVLIHDSMPVVANRVYVMPPDAALALDDATLRLLPRSGARAPMPIDRFLGALAAARGVRAIAAILSGTGTDGSMGARAVQNSGGFVFAQDPREAEFAGMPTSAIATGCVGATLGAAALGPAIARLAQADLAQPALAAAADQDGQADAEALAELLDCLRSAVNVDFRRYRSTTVQRRLRRRLALRGIAELPDYLAYVRENPAELQALASDMLIAVTRFFRDPEVFECLERTAFPELIRRASAERPVRIWAPGCASGEEAFSLAIAFVETAQRMRSGVTCTIFATDINETVLASARRAIYPDSIRAEVGEDRLQRWFSSTNGEHRLQREIRDLCVFSRHDLLRDPPFSRMDMISCRNLLIYLEGAHHEALTTFHFALAPRGLLLLGMAEDALARPELFEAVAKDMRLFRAIESVSGRAPPRPAAPRDAVRPPATIGTPGHDADATAYEELLAANEELQSLNEELESAKEETESVNEELVTVNQELRSRNSELHIAQQFAEATLDTVRSGLVVLDRELRIVRANRSFLGIFQRTHAEVAQQSLSALAPDPFANAAFLQMLEQVRATGSPVDSVELECAGRDGTPRALLLNVRRFVPGDQFLVSVDDVTLLRAMEADRRHAQKMEAIGYLAAGVAHDFNNLLTPVLSGSQLLLASMERDSADHALVAGIAEAARRAAELTRQLLAYAGKSRSVTERVQISEVVTQSANLLHSGIPPQIQLRLDLERDLPLVLADRSQLHQIVDNLIKNAIEAIGAAEGSVLVRTGRLVLGRHKVTSGEERDKLPPGDYVFVEVHDTGSGMSAETQRRMFDPFFTTKFTGRGLGLAAVQGIVRQHHGAIEVRSVLGRGTTIRVLLAAGSPAASVAQQDLPSPTPRLAARTGTVLVVDDDPLVLDFEQLVLASIGHRVLTADGCAQALAALQAHRGVDVVVLDATMPGMDGASTLRAIRELHENIPVIVCSGMGNTVVEDAFAGMVVSGFLQKPFTMQQITDAVAACMTPR